MNSRPAGFCEGRRGGWHLLYQINKYQTTPTAFILKDLDKATARPRHTITAVRSLARAPGQRWVRLSARHTLTDLITRRRRTEHVARTLLAVAHSRRTLLATSAPLRGRLASPVVVKRPDSTGSASLAHTHRPDLHDRSTRRHRTEHAARTLLAVAHSRRTLLATSAPLRGRPASPVVGKRCSGAC